jgi:hypothetical protein
VKGRRERDTKLFNNASRIAQDPDRAARVAMEQVLKLQSNA